MKAPKDYELNAQRITKHYSTGYIDTINVYFYVGDSVYAPMVYVVESFDYYDTHDLDNVTDDNNLLLDRSRIIEFEYDNVEDFVNSNFCF